MLITVAYEKSELFPIIIQLIDYLVIKSRAVIMSCRPSRNVDDNNSHWQHQSYVRAITTKTICFHVSAANRRKRFVLFSTNPESR